MREILLISNDQICLKKKEISSNYNDTVNIIEAISKAYNIFLISEKSKSKKNFLIKFKNKITSINLKFLFNLKKKKF